MMLSSITDPPVLSIQLSERKLLAESPLAVRTHRANAADEEEEIGSLKCEIARLRSELSSSRDDGRSWANKATQTDSITTDVSPRPSEPDGVQKSPQQTVEKQMCLDEAMRSFLELHPEISKWVSLSKVSECVFLMNQTRKIHVRLVNDKILVRIGGGWQELESFLTAHSSERLVVKSPRSTSDPSSTGLHQHTLASQKKITRVIREEVQHE